MTKRFSFVLIFFLLASLVGCAHSTIVPFHQDASGMTEPLPTKAQNIGIYRVSHPFQTFDEIGLITFRSRALDLNGIYHQLRKDAAAKGADAIIDLKMSGEMHDESVMTQICTVPTRMSWSIY